MMWTDVRSISTTEEALSHSHVLENQLLIQFNEQGVFVCVCVCVGVFVCVC